ncbi:MAG: hypothetical protein MR694_08685 [Spirochaetia bacterium]|nr:hypothetical protein [Spirochaetia bacterium]
MLKNAHILHSALFQRFMEHTFSPSQPSRLRYPLITAAEKYGFLPCI